MQKIIKIIVSFIFLSMSHVSFAAVTPIKNSDNNIVLAAIEGPADYEAANSIAVSTDIGATWTAKNVNLPPYPFLYKISCAGRGNHAVCVAVGRASIDGAPSPLIEASVDGGETWQTKSIANYYAAEGMLTGVTCKSQGENVFCVAVGEQYSLDNHYWIPFVASSNDGGNTWQYKTIAYNNPNEVSGKELDAVSCSDGPNAVCVAVAGNGHAQSPIIVVSSDQGNTWQVKQTSFEKDNSVFNAVSCTGSGSTTICAAAGNDDDSGQGLIAVSKDRGNTWTLVTEPNATFHALSCVGNGTDARCFAGGQMTDGDVFMSTDGANTWKKASIFDDPYSGFIGTQMSCVGFDAVTTCVVADLGSNVLGLSRDGGATWRAINPGLGNTHPTSASCTGSGASDSICILGTLFPSKVMVSSDGGKSWALHQLDQNYNKIYDVSATGGIF